MEQTTTPTAGSMFAAKWGVEQTNVEFYEVTRATAKTVWLRPVATATKTDPARLTYLATPRAGEFTGPEFRRKYVPGECVRISPGELARLWDGSPVRGSTYA